MTTVTIDDLRLKEVIKSAMLEIFQERRDLMLDLIEEAIEDLVLARAIQEGQYSDTVSREQVFAVLEGQK